MPTKLKVLQVIPKLGYGGAETGCYDIAHYLYENDCKSYIITSGGELIKFIDKNYQFPPSSLSFETNIRHTKKKDENIHLEEIRSIWREKKTYDKNNKIL